MDGDCAARFMGARNDYCLTCKSSGLYSNHFMSNPSHTCAPCSLDELPEHACALVHHVEASDDDMRRLMSMGICAGRRIELIQHGDPMILKVFGSRLGVSRRLATRVLVIACERPTCLLGPS